MIVRHDFSVIDKKPYMPVQIANHDATCLTLIVGFDNKVEKSFRSADHALPQPFTIVDYDQVNAGLLLINQISLVLTPLISRHFDSFEMARKLNDLRYLGEYRALVSALPDCGAVKTEIRGTFPRLYFDIVELSTL